MPGFDLHTHSVASDGTTTVAENVRAAATLGLEGLGITDHDTMAGWAEAFTAASEVDIEIVAGTEFSAEHAGRSVHVLGYWISADDQGLVDELDRLRNERDHRARAIVGCFEELGFPVSYARVRELAGGAPIARPHIAAAAVEAGVEATAQAVFDRYLADGGPAYVPKHAVDPVRAVQLLTAAGGVAVLAHPGLYGARDGVHGTPEEVVEAMADAGLAGIEADHPEHHDAHRSTYRRLGDSLGLVVTGGSDFHGTAKPNRLGQDVTPREVVAALRERCPIAR